MSRVFSRPVAPFRLAGGTRGVFLIAALWVAASLAACGGGGDDSSDDAAASAASAASGASSAQASTRVEALAASTSDTWTTIAAENQAYTLAGTQAVRYGAGSAWLTMQVTGGGACSNTAFGADPAYGVVKQCQVPASAVTWSTIAAENSTFTVSGTQTVRYGAGSSWITMQFTGAGTCSNSAYGSDPDYGVVKQCQLATATSTTTWTRIAAENASFTVSGTQTVRYGSGTSWVTKSVTSAGTCSNTWFGSDPIPGTVKECDLASTGGTTTPPTTVAGVCTAPIAAVNTSATTATVGNGTPASCTEGALRAAVAAYGVVRFNCGAAPATITVTSQIEVPTNRNTVIDGENKITLDGGHTTRILSLQQNNYRTNSNGLTLQHITLANAKAPGGGYVAPNASNPSCSYGYASGAGAAILVQDASLHTIDVTFQNNAAATPGPDVGGGGIYALGSLDVTVVGSRFTGNSGSNAGAIGMLNSNLRVYNSSFSGNSANGVGENYQSAAVASCPGVGQPGQGGSGGGGGAVGIDGGDDTDVIVCGSTFTGNHATELGGALARTPDGVPRRTTIDRSVFSGNSARQAGALYVMNSAPMEILASTFSGNIATLMGAAQLQNDTFTVLNSTFSGNTATTGVAGALFLAGSSATSVIQNSTFVDNQANGGPGYFSAAIFGDSNFAINNTLFTNNTTADPWNPMQCTFNSSAGTNDLQWPRTRAVGGATDTLCVSGIGFADPLLSALADNGGPTPTRAPASNSPARNAGHNCPATDQRGQPRSSATCTIGAVE